MRPALRSFVRPASAAFLTAIAYLCARSVSPSGEELARIAQPLHFTSETLGEGELGGPDTFQLRRVHPSLDRIAGWVSSVGAGVALADLDGDGLSNDACHVDPRSDTVSVRP